MKSLNIEKIEKKKTKTVLTISYDTGSNSSININEAFKRLLAIGVLSGGSGNCVKQILKGQINDLDFEFLKELQVEMEELIYSWNIEVERIEKSHELITETHKFF